MDAVDELIGFRAFRGEGEPATNELVDAIREAGGTSPTRGLLDIDSGWRLTQRARSCYPRTMSRPARDTDWYTPAPREAEPSPVEGMCLGEFERLADQIRWFSSLTLEQRLRSLRYHQREQRWFARLRPADRGT